MKEIIKRIIRDFHIKKLPEFKPRHLQVPLNIKKIITIIGPRRAGKTWYFFQLINQLENQGIPRELILYINFEDERLIFDKIKYDQIIEAYFELYPEHSSSNLYIFFDEIQELTEWEKFIRRIYDNITPHIFLTGSNSKMLSAEIATSLRGRCLTFEIFPLSFKEFLEFKDIDYRDRYSTYNFSRIKNAFEEYLFWGGFPELVTVAENLKVNILQEYFHVMIYRDLIERYSIKDTTVLKYLLKRLIASFTKEFSVNKLFNELKSRGIKISKTSIYKLIEQVFSVFFVAFIEKFDPSLIKREMSNKKIYLYDNGFASAINYLALEDWGKLLENLVFCHLRRNTKDIFFLKNQWECDFITINHGPNVHLYQVTYNLCEDNLKRELNGIKRAMKKLNAETATLIANEISVPLQIIPEEITVVNAIDWLLDSKNNLV